MKILFLKSNIAIEPLFCGWYLWPYLIPPQTAGLYLKNRYLKTIRSYLDAPHLHKQAAQNPKLIGGQFMNIPSEHLSRVEAIAQHIQNKAKPLLDLAQDIEDLNQLVKDAGDGYSLEGVYNKVPSSLKGCVELVYDHNNYPGIHFFERALYDKYYNKSLQSLLLTPLHEDKRKFVLSTPRLCYDKEMELPFSLDSNISAMLFQSRENGIDKDMLFGTLETKNINVEQLSSFFTDVPPPKKPNREFEKDGIRVRYLGHACILLQTKSVSILIDPLISYYQPESGIERYTLHDLPEKIDYVIFTHNHLDHVAFETLLFLKHKVRHFVFPRSQNGSLLDPNLKLLLHELGFKGLIALDKMEGIAIPGGNVISFPFLGEHGDLNIQSKSAFYINLLGRKFIFAADSNNLESVIYDYIYEKIGPIDTLFLGMECDGAPLNWIYGPLLTTKVKHAHMQSRRYSGSDANKATALLKALKAKEVYIYAMGQEPWLTHIMGLDCSPDSIQITESNKFLDTCQKDNIKAKRLYGQDEWEYHV